MMLGVWSASSFRLHASYVGRHCMGAIAPVQSFTDSHMFDRCEMRFVSRGGSEPRMSQPRALDGMDNRHGMTPKALFKTRFAFFQKAC